MIQVWRLCITTITPQTRTLTTARAGCQVTGTPPPSPRHSTGVTRGGSRRATEWEVATTGTQKCKFFFFFVSFFLTNLFFFFGLISLLRHMFSKLQGRSHKDYECSLPRHNATTYTGTGNLSPSSVMPGVEMIKGVTWRWQRGLERSNGKVYSGMAMTGHKHVSFLFFSFCFFLPN